MIDLVFVLHDRTGRYCSNIGVTLSSAFANTSQKIAVHLLHDNTLTIENKNKLVSLCDKYEHKIYFYEVKVDDRFDSERFTIGAFMKLYIPQVLPDALHKVLYLDSDICVHMDILALWSMSLQGYALAGVKDWVDRKHVKWIINEIGEEYQQYFNAGVLLLDLDKIRGLPCLVDIGLRFVEKYPQTEWADQDILNYIFVANCRLIDQKYNFLAKADMADTLEDKIYHFSGAKKPWKGYWGVYSQMYWEYFAKTPWFDGAFVANVYQQSQEKFKWLANLYQRMNGRKIVLFGAGEVGEKVVAELGLDKSRSYFVDNNSAKWGQTIAGLPVYPPDRLWEAVREEVIVIVSIVLFNEVKGCLTARDYQENEHFFDGRVLVEMEGGGGLFY